MNSDDAVAAIKRRVSVADLIERHGFHVERRGRTWRTKEHDSLTIYPEQNSWYWYSQGTGGDVFDWLQHVAGLSFEEALDRLRDPVASLPPPRALTPARPVQPPELAQDLHLRYHRNLDAEARAWWHSQGIGNDAISRFFLGYCEYHPIWRQPTYTIPVIEGGKLVNVRHRLLRPYKAGDKYRPETGGIPASLFNGDILTPELAGVVIVAGEKKAIVLWQAGLPAISSTSGCGHWRDEWTTRLQFCRKVYVAFDPGESQHAWHLAGKIGERAYVVNLPDKPDDLLLAHGPDAFRAHLRTAEPFADRDYWRKQFHGRSPWGKLLE